MRTLEQGFQRLPPAGLWGLEASTPLAPKHTPPPLRTPSRMLPLLLPTRASW